MVGWVLREITDAFDAARVSCDLQFSPNVTGQRRALVEQYYHTVDWTDAGQVRQVLEVYESVLQRQEALLEGVSESDGKHARDELKKLVWLLGKDGFQWAGGSIVAMTGAPYLSDIKKAAVVFDAKHLSDQIRRMEESIEKDPALSIGTSKELIETTCKTILASRGKTVAGNPDIPTLTKETLKVLKLVPESIPDAARGADIIKRLLSNLGTIGNGLAELRGLYGTGHGKHGAAVGLRAR
jgi:Abortive infection C-terminus